MKTVEPNRDTAAEGRHVRPTKSRERLSRRAAIALTGMLGVAWAAVILSRYPTLIAG
ncbi:MULTISPECIES: hypothetical protein [unclassified Methylobacterium]|uniref:hypothetical protein n=1 Tax=unclassified Methylobacterium TaxID=2615210 RepID=UPI000B0B8A4A|nr:MULTISPECIES: hypothetical protein [unclassified Methylobacterium]